MKLARRIFLQFAAAAATLPVGGLGARRSLLAVENLAAAVETVLAAPAPLRRALIVADRQALTVAEMVAAMRDGLGRRPNVFALSPVLLEVALRVAGREEIFQRLSGSLVADASALMSLGWAPAMETRAGLAGLMRAGPQGERLQSAP